MQGLADGYFVLPSTISNYLADWLNKPIPGTDHEEFKKDLRVTGSGDTINQTLEKAGRVDDFFELGMLMCRDALEREESCGGHFRAEYQTEEGEALRDDEQFAHVAAWEWTGDPADATRHREELVYEELHFQTRSYK
jgi:succinate dehydrogenase / fumarate reductase flavoprotein subunit